MMDTQYRAWAEINVDHILHNIQEIKKITTAKIMAVIKADAYGHGFLAYAKLMLENGVDMLAVAALDEAIQLRREQIGAPLIILGGVANSDIPKMVEYDVIPTIYSYETAKLFSEEGRRQGKTVQIHLKVDTGMNRIGFHYKDPTIFETIGEIHRLPGIEINGIFTHFACSDEADPAYTEKQFARFMQITDKLQEMGISIPIRHCCNSAATVMYPDMHLDMVRAGIIIYGHYPSDEVDKKRLQLKEVMSLKAVVTHIKEVEAGERVSYGGCFTTQAPTKIATVSIGYADGYSRLLSNKAQVIAGGKKVNLIGRICMDQCMIDVTNVNNISVGDEVVLFGASNGLSIPVEELANMMGTINYEVLCVIGKRVPRVYIHGGKVIAVINYLV